jgi:NDP-sugar pyrophosphorylase family protein
MNDYEYSVIVDNVVIAKGMTIGNAVILLKALFQEWHNEDGMKISIQKNLVERCVAGAEN